MDESPNLVSNTSNYAAPSGVPAPGRGRGKWLTITLAVGLAASLVAVAVLATKLTAAGNEGRTVSVTGEAVLKEVPDEYVFYPSYMFQNADKAAALDELNKKSEAVVAGLKAVGLSDKNIKVNSNGYDSPRPYEPEAPTAKESTYNLQLTVTVGNKELAQKVQDYLVTTTPAGSVSPTAAFSEAKRKELESKARDEATKDARSKADQSAGNLGFKVGKVRSVADGSGFGGGGVVTMEGRAAVAPTAADSMSSAQLSVQPGENELRYSVTVVYEIR